MSVGPGKFKNPGWRASTQNLVGISKFINEWNKYASDLKEYNKKNGTKEEVKWSETEKNEYLWYDSILKAVGKTASQVLNDNKKGVEQFVIVMNSDIKASKKSSVIATTFAFMHEIVAHLINNINGINDTEYNEHLTFFGLSKELRESDSSLNELFNSMNLYYLKDIVFKIRMFHLIVQLEKS